MKAYLSISMDDSYSRTTKKLIEVEEQLDLATYIAVAAAYLTDLQAMTDLGVARCDLILKGVTAGFAEQDPSNIDVGATFVGELADADGRRAAHKVPGIKDALVSADGTIDVENVTVAAYLDNFLTAGDLMLSDGQTISAWLRGKLDK